MKDEHFKLKNKFSKFLVKIEFLTKNHEFREFLKTSVLSFGYPDFQKRKHFCNILILKTRITVNMQPLSPPILFLVTANFMGSDRRMFEEM